MPWIIAAVAIAIIFVGGSTLKDTTTEKEANQVEGSVITASSTMLKPITAGALTYGIGGVDWKFALDESSEVPRTTVRLQLTGVTRNGVAVSMLPYRLGTYTGTCAPIAELDADAYDAEKDGAPVAFAQCWYAGIGSQHIVFQKDNMIVAKVRTISEEDESYPPLNQVLSIDLASVIK